jgi:hypothetical protein
MEFSLARHGEKKDENYIERICTDIIANIEEKVEIQESLKELD